MPNTTNLDMPNPDEGGDYDVWGDLLDEGRQKADKAHGSQATITTASGTHTLTQDESNHAQLMFTATLTGNLTVDTLAGKSRFWFVYNGTSGSYSITFQVAGGAGESVTVTQGKWSLVNTDGTDCRIVDLSTLGGLLNDNQVALSKLAQIATRKLLGNSSGSTANVGEVDFLDEDDMASDSANAVPSQQSVKAFVTNKVPGTITISEDTPSGGVDGDLWFRVLP